MATNPFPPQAYTRDTLIKAFEWLQTQSPQVRELATTNDLLISLFTKSQMQGKDALELPQLASFKNELRSLAGQMGKFEEETPPVTPAAPVATPPPVTASAPPAPTTSAPKPAPMPTMATPPPAPAMPAQGQISLNMATRPAAPNVNLVLDSKSQAWLEEIQRELNLESPAEALRLAVSVGYGRLSELFPKR